MIVEMHSSQAGKFAALSMRVPGKSILKSAATLSKAVGLTLLYVFAFAFYAGAQTATTDRPGIRDSATIKATDTMRLAQNDSSQVATDSLKRTALEDSLGIRISPDALPSVVTAKATDSAVMDMEKNLFFLYGDAQVDYEDLTLKAGQVMYNQADNTVSAVPLEDSATKAERPSFKQGSETFTYDYLKYNFKSKRAIVRNARTQ